MSRTLPLGATFLCAFLMWCIWVMQNNFQLVLKTASVFMFLVYATYGGLTLAFSNASNTRLFLISSALAYVLLPLFMVYSSWKISEEPAKHALILILSAAVLLSVYFWQFQTASPNYLGEIGGIIVVVTALLFIWMKKCEKIN